MKCQKCGEEVNEQNKFCPHCGAKLETYFFWDIEVEFNSETMEKSKIVQGKKIILNNEEMLKELKRAEAQIISLYSSMIINDANNVRNIRDQIKVISQKYNIASSIVDELNYRVDKEKQFIEQKLMEKKARDRKPLQKINFWKVLILSILTCQIYMMYTQWRLIEDINAMCDGDGKDSPSFLGLIFLTFITGGMYGFYWIYTQSQRLYEAAPGYGTEVKETGKTIILWSTIGALLVGIGPLVALYKIIKNRNTIAERYNLGIVNAELNHTEKQKMGLLPKILCIIGFIFWIVQVGAYVASVYTLINRTQDDIDYDDINSLEFEDEDMFDMTDDY